MTDPSFDLSAAYAQKQDELLSKLGAAAIVSHPDNKVNRPGFSGG